MFWDQPATCFLMIAGLFGGTCIQLSGWRQPQTYWWPLKKMLTFWLRSLMFQKLFKSLRIVLVSFKWLKLCHETCQSLCHENWRRNVKKELIFCKIRKWENISTKVGSVYKMQKISFNNRHDNWNCNFIQIIEKTFEKWFALKETL